MTKKDNSGPIPQDLFKLLACPVCKADLRYTKDKKGLACTKCKAKYRIEGSVPILLPPKSQ